MSNLLELQHKFHNYLLHSDLAIQQQVMGTTKVSAETRLAIYGEAYRARLVEALESNYPVLYAYLGHDQFEALGHAYLHQYPSTFQSIRWFGNQLPAFLQAIDDYKEDLYLAEIAQVEWTMTLVFDAADAPILQLEDMGKIPPDEWVNMRLQPHPSTYLLNLSWNVIPIWQAMIDDEAPPEPLQSQPVTWIFWRNDLINRFCSLTEDEAWALAAMQKGLTFGDICEGLCQWVTEEEAAMHAVSLLKGWITEGIISGINY